MRLHGLMLALALAATTAAGNTYTVTSTADSGAGTLRQAILDANANPGADTIAFGVVGSGVHTIAPASALAAITGPVTIDGYTQSGSSANTNPTSQGLNTVLRIEIDCTNAGGACIGVQADNVTIRGLAINRCTDTAIETTSSHQNLAVEGCFLGTNPAGTQALEPYVTGVRIVDHANARIGGTTPAARNLISGGYPNGYQILVSGSTTGTLVAGNLIGTDITGVVKLAQDGMSAFWIQGGTNLTIGGTSAAARNVFVNSAEVGGTGTVIQGNYIGTDVSGTIALGCYGWCINIIGPNNVIGGSAAGAGNRIGGDWTSTGIQIIGAGTVIQGNFIGTDPTGTARLGHSQYGIFTGGANTIIGGLAPGEGNVVANNVGKGGIGVWGTTGVRIRGNLLFDNNGLGIELLQGSGDIPGVTYNDAGDGDTGGNNFQNFPAVTSVVYGGSSTTVTGVLDSAASTVYDVDVYAGIECASRPQELPEAKTYLGTTQVTTDGSGHGTFNEVFPIAVAANTPITATATDPGGNTSELSPLFVVRALPRSGSPAGGNQSVYGLDFQAGASVTVGGLPATNVNVQDPHTLTMHTPALPAGSINDIVVSTPGGGQSGTLRNGYVADFNDIGGSLFYESVIQLVANSITAGIGGGNYGVDNSTLRQQMAVFLLKAKYGVCYAPPPCQHQFPDVACPSTFANWIEALADEGITSGCGGGLYCPANPVTRQQMAVFLLKAEHGSGYVPPPCDGDFGDVACPGNPFANWIEQLAAEHITAGCAGGQNYCPLNNVTRGQMAAFLVNTFNLP